jgi:hypothetical protein
VGLVDQAIVEGLQADADFLVLHGFVLKRAIRERVLTRGNF